MVSLFSDKVPDEVNLMSTHRITVLTWVLDTLMMLQGHWSTITAGKFQKMSQTPVLIETLEAKRVPQARSVSWPSPQVSVQANIQDIQVSPAYITHHAIKHNVPSSSKQSLCHMHGTNIQFSTTHIPNSPSLWTDLGL